MGTSVGAAIDYLVAAFRSGYTGTDIYGAPLTVAGVGSDVNVVDVYDSSESGPWVVVGRAGFDQSAELTASAAYQVLGRQRVLESYTIPGVILVEGQGPDYKPVRDRALALFDTVTKIVWADPTLGGVLKDGRIGLVSEFRVTHSDPRADRGSASGAGIAAEVSFGIQVENNYLP